ncbi:MAG TPA: hypothetical protein VHB50_17090, partial [Bryobacteraceae bacterium]|nr:hypothetical protein [Bryobacteraceae bacterium]
MMAAPQPGPEREQTEAFEIVDWAEIVARIHDGDVVAMEELYEIFAKGIRYFLLRNLGPVDIDDKVHDCFVVVAQAIRKGELRDPARLMGFVRTVVKRQVAGTIQHAVNRRKTEVDYEESLTALADWTADPEHQVLHRQRS